MSSTATPAAIRYTNDTDVDLYPCDLGYADEPFDVYIGQGSDHMTVTFHDDTRFHFDRDFVTMGRHIENIEQAANTAPAVAAALHAYNAAATPDLMVEIDGENCQAIAYSIALPLPAEGLTADEIGEQIAGFVALMVNVTDPGTFGDPYLYDLAAKDLPAQEVTPEKAAKYLHTYIEREDCNGWYSPTDAAIVDLVPAVTEPDPTSGLTAVRNARGIIAAAIPEFDN